MPWPTWSFRRRNRSTSNCKLPHPAHPPFWKPRQRRGLYERTHTRNPPWQNYQKALEYIPKFAPYSNSGYHFSLGAVYRANCDFVSSWAHYTVARYLGSNDAVERLTSLESQLTKKETQRALTLSQTIKNDLKPVPTAITLQGPGV